MFGDGARQIPSDAEIESVTLYLDTTNPGSDQALHQMLVPWDENEVVWNDFGSDGLTPDDVNARLQADVRFATPAELLAIDIPASTLQTWLNGDSENHGWVTQPTATDGQDFLSSENDEIDRRPKLEVVWTLETDEPSEASISISSDAGQIVLEYEGGDLYQGSSVVGPFTLVDGANSPHQIPISDAAAFFIVR